LKVNWGAGEWNRTIVLLRWQVLNTKVVLITEALTGIGHAAALADAKEGAPVFIVPGGWDEAGTKGREFGLFSSSFRASTESSGAGASSFANKSCSNRIHAFHCSRSSPASNSQI
jgi:NAD(P)-dependent dehydrogenase (short-subunit alcohol dehydrogenase family)